MSMTLREWFSRFETATGETPLFICFGPAGFSEFASVESETLDREFDEGFGGTESPDFCAWSDNWVLFSDNYDGAEDICWVPRNPIAHNPLRPGGG